MAKKANFNDRATIREACIAINDYVSDQTGIHSIDDWVTPETLEPNEMFFITESSLRDLVENRGICDRNAEGIVEYLNSKASKVPMTFYSLRWGYIFRVDETEFLIYSNSWSDSAPFVERAERTV